MNEPADSTKDQCSANEPCSGNDSIQAEHVERIVNEYSERLLTLIRKNLRRNTLRNVTEDDVLQTAYGSFFRRRYHLKPSDEIAKLLFTVVLRKAWKANKKKRDVADEATDLPIDDTVTQATKIASHEPAGKRIYRRGPKVDQRTLSDPSYSDEAITAMSYGAGPQDAAIAIDLMELLSDDLKAIVGLRLCGFSDEEIGDSLNCSEKSIKRRVAHIKTIWLDEVS